MRIRKIFSIGIIFVLCIALLAACGKKEAENSGIEATAADGMSTVATIEYNGEKTDIILDQINFYICRAAISAIYSQNNEFDGNFSAVDWSAAGKSGKPLEEEVKAAAMNDITGNALLVMLGEKNGVKATEEELSQIYDTLEQYQSNGEEELLNKNLRTMGVTSIDGYKQLASFETTLQKAETDFSKNKDKYVSDDVDLAKYKSEDYVSAQHILIMSDSEKHSNPEETINDVLARARNGEDFLDLMKEFNEDPGEPDAGYSFGRGEMVPEFEAAAFALDYDSISDVVKSDYGFHIIKRVAGLTEVKNYLRESAKVTTTDAFSDISVKDLLVDVYNVTNELSQQSNGN